MARYPSCEWKPISGTSRTALRPEILCLHTCVGYLRSTWNYFNRPDVSVYSHICVGGIWGSDAAYNLDGVAWQMADTRYRAAANLDGNGRIISVETADNAARPIQPWTPKQCDRIVRIMVDAHRLDGIPLVLIPDSKPGRRGIGYHRQGCDPYRVSGGERWSTAFGKDCPTQARINQIPALIDRARRIVDGRADADPIQQEDITMDADTRKYFDEKFAALNGLEKSLYQLLGYGDERVDTKADTHPENLQRIRQELAELRQLVEERLPAPEPTP